MEKDEEYIDLVEILYALLRRAWLLVLVGLLGGAFGLGYSKLIAVPLYQSSAMMIVNSTESGDYYNNSNYVTFDQLRSASTLVSTYSIIIKSDTVMDEVKKSIYFAGHEAFDDVVRDISVDTVNDTQIMEITVTATSPEAALKVCSRITEVCPEVILNTVKAGSVETISKPKVTEEAISPNTRKNMAVGAAAGFMFVAMVITLITIVDNKVKDETDIQKENLALVGIIPGFEKRSR